MLVVGPDPVAHDLRALLADGCAEWDPYRLPERQTLVEVASRCQATGPGAGPDRGDPARGWDRRGFVRGWGSGSAKLRQAERMHAAGTSVTETAEALGVGRATVYRHVQQGGERLMDLVEFGSVLVPSSRAAPDRRTTSWTAESPEPGWLQATPALAVEVPGTGWGRPSASARSSSTPPTTTRTRASLRSRSSHSCAPWRLRHFPRRVAAAAKIGRLRTPCRTGVRPGRLGCAAARGHRQTQRHLAHPGAGGSAPGRPSHGRHRRRSTSRSCGGHGWTADLTQPDRGAGGGQTTSATAVVTFDVRYPPPGGCAARASAPECPSSALGCSVGVLPALTESEGPEQIGGTRADG